MVDQVVLNVNGGLPTADSNVEYLDVDNYFNSCLPASIEEEFEQRQVFAKRMGEDYLIDEEFVQRFELDVEKDGCLMYADFSPRYQGLPGNSGVRNVFSCDFSRQFTKLSSFAQLQGVDLPGNYCWFGEKAGKQRVYLKGDVDKIMVEIVVLADDIGQEDRVVAPGQVLESCILRMTNYFRSQKTMPTDGVPDGTDAAVAAQRVVN